MDTVNRLNGYTNGHTPPPAPPPLPEADREGLTQLEAALLAVLTDQELKPAAVARRAGKNPHQHVYAALKSLVAKGRAEKCFGGGYRRVGGSRPGLVIPAGMVVLKQMAEFGGPLSVLVQVLGAVVASPPAEPAHFEMQANGVRVLLDLRPLSQSLDAVPDDGLSPLAKALLGVLTPAWQTAKTLARLAGYAMGSHVYAALRELQHREPPLCVKTPEGFRLP